MRFDPSDLLGDTAYTAGGVFLLGKNYLIPSISWQVNTLLGLSFQTAANLDDDSVFVSINGDYSLSDNLYMGMGYYHFAGDELKFLANLPSEQQHSLVQSTAAIPTPCISAFATISNSRHWNQSFYCSFQ